MSGVTTEAKKAEFGKWRSFFWPIHNFELKKFIPMFFLLFFINFNYTILRDMKDTLIVTAPGSGAEAIPFLKVWGVLPFAILFMIIYSKLSNVMSKQKLFYCTISYFVSFFTLFAFVLYPLRELLHPSNVADALQNFLPAGFKGLIAVFRNWTFALFYIMSELWGSVALSLLFWGFANDTTKVAESKRFYALFGLGANVAMWVSSPCMYLLSTLPTKLGPNVDHWKITLNYLTGMVILAGLLVMGIYWWINRNVLTDTRFYNPAELQRVKKEKPKMSLKESFKFLARSKYIGLLAVLVISYGIAINLVEVTWKGQLKEQFPSSNEYMAFMAIFSLCTSSVAILMMLFVGGNVIRRFGWKAGALFTPIALGITGALFFTFVLFRDSLTPSILLLGTTPLFLSVIVGMIQNILSKTSKYSLFDPTKEMAYIPLDQESKVKGKAAVDVVGARLGKAGGSILQQVLLVIFGSLANITGPVAILLVMVIFGWIFAANGLGNLFHKVNREKEEQERLAAEADEKARIDGAKAQTTQESRSKASVQ